MHSLTRWEWIRVGFALALVAMAAFCAFEAYLHGYSNRSGVASVAQTARSFRIAQQICVSWLASGSCSRIGVGAPVSIEGGRGTAFNFRPILTRYLPAIVISTFVAQQGYCLS
jgi:hypothetical protein